MVEILSAFELIYTALMSHHHGECDQCRNRVRAAMSSGFAPVNRVISPRRTEELSIVTSMEHTMLPYVAELGLVDHHCHGVMDRDLERDEFESLLTEADAPAPGITLFDSLAGLAVRRWCAPVLGLPAHVSPGDYLAAVASSARRR
jgi:hypothetical protein